jgi:cytochrome c
MQRRDRRMLARALATCAALFCAACAEQPAQVQIAGADVERGRVAIQQYGCVACHAVPGVRNPGGNVGPPLAGLAKRGYIGGVLPNTPDELVRWLLDPPGVDPRTAMPNVGLNEADAKDIAAYLYTLH